MEKTYKTFLSVVTALCLWLAGNLLVTSLPAHGQEDNPNDPAPVQENQSSDLTVHHYQRCDDDDIPTGPYTSCGTDVPCASGHCSKYVYHSRRCQGFSPTDCTPKPNVLVFVDKYYVNCIYRASGGGEQCGCPTTGSGDPAAPIAYGTPIIIKKTGHDCH